jgi:hypothetical protein
MQMTTHGDLESPFAASTAKQSLTHTSPYALALTWGESPDEIPTITGTSIFSVSLDDAQSHRETIASILFQNS